METAAGAPRPAAGRNARGISDSRGGNALAAFQAPDQGELAVGTNVRRKRQMKLYKKEVKQINSEVDRAEIGCVVTSHLNAK